MSPPLLSVDALTITLNEKCLLDSISFEVEESDYLCILGPNGAGKSSLLKALMSIIKPSHGEVYLQQRSSKTLSQKQRARWLSYVPQRHQNTLNFTVTEFIKMARYPHQAGFSNWAQSDQEAFEQAVEMSQIMPFLARTMPSLSGGELQRVMIAAALCQQTPLLLLDEPASFLDPHHQIEMHYFIQQLNQQHGITIIEVTHDINHAHQHSQHILALKNGQIQWHGRSEEFIQSAALQKLYEHQFVFASHPQTGARIALPNEHD